MKALFWVGLVVLILGIASLVVPIPHTDRESLTVGGVSLGFEAQHQENLSPALSGVMILGGLGAMAGRRKNS
jgi:LPXTG-motif cell wall-anchored protein